MQSTLGDESLWIPILASKKSRRLQPYCCNPAPFMQSGAAVRCAWCLEHGHTDKTCPLRYCCQCKIYGHDVNDCSGRQSWRSRAAAMPLSSDTSHISVAPREAIKAASSTASASIVASNVVHAWSKHAAQLCAIPAVKPVCRSKQEQQQLNAASLDEIDTPELLKAKTENVTADQEDDRTAAVSNDIAELKHDTCVHTTTSDVLQWKRNVQQPTDAAVTVSLSPRRHLSASSSSASASGAGCRSLASVFCNKPQATFKSFVHASRLRAGHQRTNKYKF